MTNTNRIADYVKAIYLGFLRGLISSSVNQDENGFVTIEKVCFRGDWTVTFKNGRITNITYNRSVQPIYSIGCAGIVGWV
jgi:hypothetical protein